MCPSVIHHHYLSIITSGVGTGGGTGRLATQNPGILYGPAAETTLSQGRGQGKLYQPVEVTLSPPHREEPYVNVLRRRDCVRVAGGLSSVS